MSNFMCWTLQLRPMGGGFVGAKRCIDLETGAETVHRFRLNAAGKVVAVLPLDHLSPAALDRLGKFELPPVASSPSLPLAASDSAALRHNYMALQPLVLRRAPQGVAAVTCFGDEVWVLAGDPLQPDVAQSLLHLDLSGDRPLLRDLPLAALTLGGVRRITALATVNGYVYAAVCDPLAGFDLFRLDATLPDADFAPVLTGGAHRFALNTAICALDVREDALLIGTAALASGVNPVGQWGPELLVLDADDDWDLVIGQPRFTPDGMRFPASNLLPGLGRLENAAIRAIATGQVGANPLTCIAVQDHAGTTVADRRLLGPADLLNYSGAVRLYASQDLEEWYPVPVDLPPASGAVTALAVSSTGILIGHECLSPDDVPVTFVPHS